MRALHLSAALLSLSLASCAGSAMSASPAGEPPHAGSPGVPASSRHEAPAESALQPLDHAPLLRAQAATYMTPDELILGVEIGGDARAYPLRILDWHGVANDTVNHIPVALAYCRSCGSAVLYRTDTPKGTLTLAPSGRFRDGDQLLADRQTGTLWKQLTGTPVEGALAGSGIQLQPLPVVLTTWTSWFQTHLQTRVLSLDTGFHREYKPEGRPAGDDPAPAEGSWVYGLVIGGAARAYPIDLLTRRGVIDDELGGRPVVIVAEPGTEPKNRTVRAYERGELVFARSGHSFLGSSFVNDQAGHPWMVGEESLATPDGKKLPRLPGKLTLRAGWSAAYPQGQIYEEPEKKPGT